VVGNGQQVTSEGAPPAPTRWLGLGAGHVRFVLVGAFNTAFGYLAFAALELGFPQIPYLIVLVVSREISVVGAFVAYRWLVYKVKGNVIRDFARFWLVYVGALVLNLLALPLLVEVMGLGVLAAQTVTVGLTAVASCVGHGRYSFRRPHPGPEVAGAP